MTLADKSIVLGVTGSIAAFKAADLASKLVQAGARVNVVMTPEAREFIAPFTFRAITGRPALIDMFQPQTDQPEEHVALARRADLVVIAPCSANLMAKLVHGFADDMVSLTVLATKAPVLIAPAMDSQMWESAATQANVRALKERGRMVEPETVLGAVNLVLASDGDLAGRRLVVTAGGTREPIDPVRFITNRSSGKQGYALAEAARDRGAGVTLITAAALPLPYGVELVEVESVAQMRDVVLDACKAADVLIMAAAVSDFRPARVSEQKIKKGEDGLTLELVKNPNFLLEVPPSVVKVGFAAETENLLDNAATKLVEYGLDLICANDVTAEGAGFAVDTNRVTILDREGGRDELPLLSKYEVSQRILDRVALLLKQRRP